MRPRQMYISVATIVGMMVVVPLHAAPPVYDVLVVEEDWELTLDTVNVGSCSPQFTTAIPIANNAEFVITWNYLESLGGFVAGGIEIQLRKNEQVESCNQLVKPHLRFLLIVAICSKTGQVDQNITIIRRLLSYQHEVLSGHVILLSKNITFGQMQVGGDEVRFGLDRSNKAVDCRLGGPLLQIAKADIGKCLRVTWLKAKDFGKLLLGLGGVAGRHLH